METIDAERLRQVGRNIRAERVRRDLTQERLADLADLGPAQIARMERGEMDTGLSKYLRVAEALNVEPGKLLDPISD